MSFHHVWHQFAYLLSYTPLVLLVVLTFLILVCLAASIGGRR